VERAGVLALAALAPVAMLAVDPWGWFPFGPVKWLAVAALVPAGSALVLRARPLRVPELVRAALLVLVGWLAVAAVAGEDPTYAWIGTPERRFGVLTWGLCALALLVGRSLDVRVDGPRIVDGLLVAGLGVGAVATAEALGFEPEVLDVGTRLTGTFGSSAYLGAATALLLPVALGVALAAGPRCRRLVALVAASLLGVACLGSGARAAWLGLLVAAGVSALTAHRELWALVRHRRWAAGAGLAAAAAALAAVALLTPVGPRIAALDDTDAAGGQGRLDEWRVATEVALDHLPFGVGPEGYRVVFAEGLDLDYVREHGRDQTTDRAHSAPLDVLLAGGLVALAAWALLGTLVARSAWSLLRSGPGWQRGLAAALVAHGVGLLALFPIMELEPVAWLVAGLVLGARPVPLLLRQGHSLSSRRRVVARPLVGALAVAAVAALATGVLDVVADHRARSAADALARGDTDRALVSADDAADLRPDIVRLHLLAARAAVADERGSLAGLQRVEEALDVSPRDPVALLERSRLLVARAEATRTGRHLDTATAELQRRLAEDPFHPQLWELAARLALARGDGDPAVRARDRAEALQPGRDR
jgi:hypothetical protein